jgi:hypothetical protein
MGNYYTRSGIIREIAILVGIILVIGIVSATLYFGTVNREVPKPSEVIVSEPVIEPVPTQQESIIEITDAAESPEDALFRLNGHHLGDSVSWTRENVSGFKDMNVVVTAYDYKFMDNYKWHSDSWNKDFTQYPEPGKKYLFVFAHLYMEGSDPSKDSRYYIDSDPWHRWVVQVGRTVIFPDEEYQKEHLIKELENTYAINPALQKRFHLATQVNPFGYNRIFNGREWIVQSPEWLRMGDSNSWNGYILFQVPEDTKPEDVMILSQWDTFSRPYWVIP